MLLVSLGEQQINIAAEPLTQEAFASFGDVISNLLPSVHPSSFPQHPAASLPSNASSANQGYAIKYSNVSHIRDLYDKAPSGKSEPSMSIFSCSSRQLNNSGKLNFSILERHPFTTQTFTPIASTASSYLVIVAPTLGPSVLDDGLPVPLGNGLPGRGLPNMNCLRAFVASNRQAVTYGAGTWHAPMIVLGEEGQVLDFVVYQFVSGVAEEDCQLVEFKSVRSKDTRLWVEVQGQRQTKL